MIAASFRTSEIAAALAAAAAVQALLFLLFSSSSTKPVRANLSDENSRPIAVAITPVSALPSDSHRPRRLPRSWQRHARDAALARAVALAPKQDEAARAEQPAPDAGSPAAPAGTAAQASSQSSAVTDDSQPAAAAGASGGADDDAADGLKRRAVDLYRRELVAWFMARFDIRGKLPFATLKGLRAVATISVTPEHTVGAFTLSVESGNPVFDAQVQATLAAIAASGASLPPPPPLYPDLLGDSLSVSFKCTVRKDCE